MSGQHQLGLTLVLLALTPGAIVQAELAAPSSVTNTIVSQRPAGSTVTLGPVLVALESYGSAFQLADTTARKDQIRAEARAKGEALLNGKQMVVRNLVRDVRVVSPGMARVSYDTPDMRPFDPKKKPVVLHVSAGGSIVVPMTESEVLKLSKGMVIELAGRARMGDQQFSLMPNAPTTNAEILRTIMARDTKIVGCVYLDDVKWRTFAPSTARR